MSDPIARIEEQRLAFLELTLLRKQIRADYGDNPPAEVLKTIAELAKAYQSKWSGSSGKKGTDQEFEHF